MSPSISFQCNQSKKGLEANECLHLEDQLIDESQYPGRGMCCGIHIVQTACKSWECLFLHARKSSLRACTKLERMSQVRSALSP